MELAETILRIVKSFAAVLALAILAVAAWDIYHDPIWQAPGYEVRDETNALELGS